MYVPGCTLLLYFQVYRGVLCILVGVLFSHVSTKHLTKSIETLESDSISKWLMRDKNDQFLWMVVYVLKLLCILLVSADKYSSRALGYVSWTTIDSQRREIPIVCEWIYLIFPEIWEWIVKIFEEEVSLKC